MNFFNVETFIRLTFASTIIVKATTFLPALPLQNIPADNYFMKFTSCTELLLTGIQMKT